MAARPLTRQLYDQFLTVSIKLIESRRANILAATMWSEGKTRNRLVHLSMASADLFTGEFTEAVQSEFTRMDVVPRTAAHSSLLHSLTSRRRKKVTTLTPTPRLRDRIQTLLDKGAVLRTMVGKDHLPFVFLSHAEKDKSWWPILNLWPLNKAFIKP